MDNDFFKKVDKMFEDKLAYEDRIVIRIENVKDKTILENINYNYLLFDSNLNMYKLQPDGKYVKIIVDGFRPVIVVRELKKPQNS